MSMTFDEIAVGTEKRKASNDPRIHISTKRQRPIQHQRSTPAINSSYCLFNNFSNWWSILRPSLRKEVRKDSRS